MEKLSSRGLLIGLLIALMILGPGMTLVQANDVVKVGIIQIAEHPALDGARQGFIDSLADNGYVEGENIVYEYQNAQGDISTANTIAQKFAWEDLDLILAIATPAAQAAANVISDVPILITAVTDPVGAGLVKSIEKPETNVSGTTDMTPDLVLKQIKLITEFKPEAKKIGTVYNAGEANSLVQLEAAKAACEELGLTLVEATADSTAGVLQAAQSLANRVDALYVFTDNTVVSAIESVIMVAEENKLPLIVGEEDSVKRGALATVGISYYKLGQQTGKMALKILKDRANVAEIPVERQKDLKLVINKKAADRMGVSIPEELMDRAEEVYE